MGASGYTRLMSNLIYGLNPFEIRAWVLQLVAEKKAEKAEVSIPLKSGHGCFNDFNYI